ncbi:MAG: ATP-binding protein [Acidobacteriota bacterium]|nr:ATP-binding protein [Blastocatellia bacterium]MDW8239603.1 ATP-binding protein [Acidobacteriota bacterium]
MKIAPGLNRADLRTALLLCLTCVLVVIAILNLRAWIGQPQVAWDGVTWEDATRGVVARAVELGSPAERAGVRRGDRLTGVSLDGGYQFEPIAHASDVQIYLEAIGVHNKISYLIERTNLAGSVSRYAADIDQLSAKPVRLWPYGYFVIVGLAYLIIGLYVLLRQRQARHTLHFYAVCLTAFVVYAFHNTERFDRLDWVVFYADNIALILLGPLFLHFCAVFPEKRKILQRHGWAASLIYVPAGGLLLGELSLPFLTDQLGEQARMVRVQLDFLTSNVQFIACFVGGAALLLQSFMTATTPLLKQQLKWVVWGMLGGVPFTLYLLFVQWIPTFLKPSLEAVALIPLIFIPLSFSYSIVRYRLMDVDVIMRRSLVHLTTTLVMAGLFVLLLLSARDFVATASDVVIVLMVIGAVVLAMLFAPLKSYLQERIDRFVYGERYSARAGVREFAQMLSTMTTLEPMLHSVSERLQNMLFVEEIALFIRDAHEPSGFQLAHRRHLRGPVKLSAAFFDQLRQSEPPSGILCLDESATEISEHEQLNGLRYFVPCRAHDRLIAVIGLGRTKDGDLLTSEDLDLLAAIAPYVAVAVENSLLYREQAQRAEELAHLKDFNESIVESINVGILAVDPDGTITTWNSAMEELLGINRMEAIGRRIHRVFDPELIRALRGVIGGSRWAVPDARHLYQFRTQGHNGRELCLNLSIAPFKTKQGERVGSLIVVEDISQRQRLEQQLQQSEKLSSIGLLAAGVAHEVNTPLTGISSYTQMLLKQLPPTDPRFKLLVKIEEQARRASNIVTNLLNFSRTGATEFVPLDLNRVVEDTLQLVEPQLRGKAIRLVKQLSDQLEPVMGNATKLQQVLMNLLLNARDAMPDGGVLTIKTRLDAGMVLVEVADTGVGIAQEHIRRIYDPFFTTKGIGQGTGLGLALSYGIIQEHGGRIDVESQVGQGTQFTIYLPTYQPQMNRRRTELRLVSGD